VEQAAQ